MATTQGTWWGVNPTGGEAKTPLAPAAAPTPVVTTPNTPAATPTRYAPSFSPDNVYDAQGNVVRTMSPTSTSNVSGAPAATSSTTISPDDQKLLGLGITPEQLKALNSGTMDPASFNSLIGNIETKLKLNNDLVTYRGFLMKGLYDSPLTPDEISKLPEDLQRVVKTGDKNTIELQLRLLNDQIAGRANTLSQSINYLTTGYQDAVKQKQEAVNNFVKFAQQFPNAGDAAKALEAIYGPQMIAQLGINIPELSYLMTTAGVRYGGGTGGMTVDIPEGTIAAQTNNPLNIKYSSTSPAGGVDSGIAAQDGGTFASYSTPQEGLQAAVDLLKSSVYSNLSVDQAMRQWSNGGYGAEVSPSMNGAQKMNSLSEEQLQQLVSDMAQRESGASVGYAPTEIEAIAQGIESGLQPPDLSRLYGKSAQVRAQLAKDGFDLTKATLQWQAATRATANLNSAQMVRFRGLGITVVNTIDEVRRLSDELKLGGVPKLNLAQMTAWLQLNNNHPYAQKVAQYLAAANTLKEEFANLAQGGYAPTEASWELANKQINEYYGSDALKASLTEVQRLINYRLSSFTQVTPMLPGGGAYTGVTQTGDYTSVLDTILSGQTQ